MSSSSLPIRIPKWALILLFVSSLDWTTSLIPATADVLWPIPAKPIWLFSLQALGLCYLLWVSWSWRHAVSKAFSGLPLPRSTALVLGTWCCIAFIHVSLRQEYFPFSPVAMFSSGVPEPQDDYFSREGYLEVQEDGGLKPIGFILESSPLFGLHDVPWDYKSGWVFHIYAYGFSQMRDAMLADLNEHQNRRILRSKFVYSRRNGDIVSPRLKENEP